MTSDDFRAWLDSQEISPENAAEVLDKNRATVFRWLAGSTPIPKSIALACSALAAGLKPWSPDQNRPTE